MKPAYEDANFMQSDEALPLRILAEYFDPKRRFESAGASGTIVFFGSARIRENGPLKRYYEAARELARQISEWQMKQPDGERLLVCTGGGPGIMEAANRGAHDAGALSAGLGIQLRTAEKMNPYITPQLAMNFRYFFMRKWWFITLARAVVIFPGGFGTMDELFELLALTQTRKIKPRAALIIYGSEYWNKAVNFEAMAEWGMISPQDIQIFQTADRPDEALRILQTEIEREAAAKENPHGVRDR